MKVLINVEKLDNDLRKTKAIKVAAEMEIIINLQLFKDNFISILERSDYRNGELSGWKNKTSLEIYDHFMSGAETLTPQKDGVMNIEVDDYYTFKSVFGYTMEHIPTIFTNTKYFDVNTTKEIGSNFCHEWGHKIGFDHDFKSTYRRNFSLCYLLNLIYEKTYNQHFGLIVDDQKIYCKRKWYAPWKKVCWYA